MNEYDVKRLALILAVQAEIEGMKSENNQREAMGQSMAYTEGSFCEASERLLNLAHAHNHSL